MVKAFACMIQECKLIELITPDQQKVENSRSINRGIVIAHTESRKQQQK